MITSVSRSFIFIFNLFWEDPRHREAGLVLKQGGWFLLHIPERRGKKKGKQAKEKFVVFGVVGEFTSMICLLFLSFSDLPFLLLP